MTRSERLRLIAFKKVMEEKLDIDKKQMSEHLLVTKNKNSDSIMNQFDK